MRAPALIRSLLVAALFAVGGILVASAVADQDISSLLGTKQEEKSDSAQTETSHEALAVPRTLANPLATLRTFMGAMNADTPDYAKAISCFDVDDEIPNNTLNQKRADRIYDILRYLGYGPKSNAGVPEDVAPELRAFSLLPAPAAASAETIRAASLLLTQNSEASINLARWTTADNGAWLFNKATLSNANITILDQTYIQLSKIDPSVRKDLESESIEGWIVVNMPDSLRNEFLFVQYWQWIGLGGLIFLGLISDALFRLIFRSILRRRIAHFLKRVSTEPMDNDLRRAMRATGILLATIIWRVGILFLFLPIDIFTILLVATNIMVVLASVYAGFKITDLLGSIFEYRASISDNKLDDLIVPLLRKTAKILIVIIGFIYFAQAIDYRITPLLAGLGIGGIGFAFAAQNSIENFFGSVTVLLDRPFQVGDWIVIDDVEGTVTAVGMRSTRVRTFYDSLVTVPNSILVNTKVNNYGMRSYRRWTTRVGLLYETRPEQVEAFCEAVRQLIREHPYMRKDYYQVFLNEFGASAIEVLVYVFWSAPDWQTELRERHRFMLDIMRVADAIGVSFAYPTRTVYLARSPGIPDVPEDLSPTQDKALNEQRGREATRRVTKDAPWQGDKPPPYAFQSREETLAMDRGEVFEPQDPKSSSETKGSEGE